MNQPSTNKKSLSVLIGAAFLMATSSIGPGFMTQTAAFTAKYQADFAFVIAASVILSYIAQLNVWSIITVSKLRGQDIANRVLPGLGYFVAFLVALGGLAFNIGNIGGAALGMNVMFGINIDAAAIVSAVIGIIVFMSRSAAAGLDRLTKYLGILMLVLIGYVTVISVPPVGTAVARTVMPTHYQWLATITLVGGTVGGYITFAGGHRLVDAGIVGKENLGQVRRSATLGIGIDLTMRVLFFLAVLGVVSHGALLDASNPAADASRIPAGEIGYRLFGLVFFCAALTSVVGAAYTSVSFLKTLFKPVGDHENLWIMGFIAASTAILILLGKPAALLIIAGSLNGLILPVTLAVMLIAAKKTNIVGDYKHNAFLYWAGWAVVVITAYIGITSLSGFAKLIG